ncbi:MAG: ABC transporter substrate-binding protein [Promethearchaeota archaeon]
MKKRKTLLSLIVATMMLVSLLSMVPQTNAAPTKDEFEIVVPWGLDHPRGKIIKSMITNHSTLGDKYDYVFTAVGGSPSDRDALTARFLAADYPELIITTQDWYTEFSLMPIWHNFAPMIAGWTAAERTDIPAGWWSILDFNNGDGTGDYIFALPFFGQSILPYVNTDIFKDAGLNYTHPEEDLEDVDEFLAACEAIDTDGNIAFAMVGDGSSDTTYMNYMLGSTDNYISDRFGTATGVPTVMAWGDNDEYGLNGTLSVEGYAAYLKMKGEGWVQPEVMTSGGGYANSLFGNGSAGMVFCGPWGTSIFENTAKVAGVKLNFTAVPMPACSDGVRSTITGGGITWVPKLLDATMKADALTLAEWLLDDENQMKTVENWLGESWRIPVKKSLTTDPWFSAFPNRSNFVTHIESQEYAYPWGKQHPEWIAIHESVLMPGYYDALLAINYDGTYTDQNYIDAAQAALDDMAQEIEDDYLRGSVTIPWFLHEPGTKTATATATVPTTVQETEIKTTVSVVTSVVSANGFGIIAAIAGIGSIFFIAKKKRKR